ncbi:MAG: threonine synthase [Dehalococcoidia bacterium]
MSNATALKCKECTREYPLEPMNVCEWCFGPLEVVYDYHAIARTMNRESIEAGPLTMWRYKAFLPVDGQVVDLGTGFTPLLKAENLGRALGLDNLYIKNDCGNPSHSFKDRVVGIASTKAKEFGFDTLACASTGNLAGSVAAHAAKAGLKAYVFIPADLEVGKVVSAAIYGPTLVAVRGSYDEVNRLCSELADKYNWAFANINMRPYYSEGSKTLGYEVAEQLGWRAPDWAIVPAASGSLFTKIWQGFKELAQVGIMDPPRTRMAVAQARGCSPIITAFENNRMDIKPVKPNTLAKSLAIGNPADGFYALKTIKETNGHGIAVTDPEVVEGMSLLGRTEGVFAETAGGVTVAGLKKLAAQGIIKRDDLTVAYITGSGLKTQEPVQELVNPLTVDPTMASFEEAMEARRNGVTA